MVKSISVPSYFFYSESSAIDDVVEKQYLIKDSHNTQRKENVIVNNDTPIKSIKSNVNNTILASRDVIITNTTSFLSVRTGTITNGYNEQTTKYIDTITNEQNSLNQETQDFLAKQAERGVDRTATNLRNKGNWMNVKRLVVREELMKLQIGDTTELPLSEADLAKLKSVIADKDLSNMSDKELQQLIDSILQPDQKQILQALKDYKENGVVSPYFQKAKLEALLDELDGIDLNKITAKQLKHIIDNYWEKLEVHHRTSISADETKQSDTDNLDTLNTSQHDKKHTHTNEDGEEKVNYKKPVEEDARDRKGELKKLNKKRVTKNEIKGLGITLLIAGAVGFSIGFIVKVAENGLDPESMKNAFVAGAESGGDAIVISGGSYALTRTIGMSASEKLIDFIVEKFGDYIPATAFNNVTRVITMGVTGSIAIMVSLVYQFVKLKIKGYSTKESLLRVGKTARLSFSILMLSLVAQGLWGGYAGLIVSVTSGVISTGIQVVEIRHDKDIRRKISLYYIELSEPKELLYLCG